MAGRDMVVMSLEEVRRLKVVHLVIEKHTTEKAAASMLKISERQVRRVVKAVREGGDRGVIHGLRGRSSNRRLSEELREQVLLLYRARYPDFGPTLASEKLFETRSAMRRCGSGSLRRAIGRRGGSDRVSVSGGRGESALARWSRWTGLTMTGWRDGVRSWC